MIEVIEANNFYEPNWRI